MLPILLIALFLSSQYPLKLALQADNEVNSDLVRVEPEFVAGRASNPLGWEWVTKDYDAGYVWTRAVETDSSENSYIAGVFRGGSLSLNQHHALNKGGLDVFVAKIDGNGLCNWLTVFGGCWMSMWKT
jgi:hypothetical protein